MEVFEAIDTRRSIRSYTDEKVTEEQLVKVLDAARKAPSWHNFQCWTYVVVSDREIIRKIGEITKRGPDEFNPGRMVYNNATYFIVVCADPAKSGEPDGKQYFMADGAITMQTLCLAAHGLGLGTCWIGSFEEAPIKALLEIPAELRIVGMTPLGVPAKRPDARPRKALEDAVFLNRYGDKLL